MLFNNKKIFFVLVFAVLSLLAYNINFSPLLGTNNQSFTVFQFFAPTSGFFLGPFLGAASVLLAQIASFVLLGKSVSAFGLARFVPMLVAAFYFGTRKKKLVGIVPVACMALFVLHPVGRQAWFYSLYWVIPIVAAFFKERLFLKSLGSTFTAHAIGSVAFLYLIPTTPILWVALIPIVFVERVLFAMGISASFVCFNSLLSWVDARLPVHFVRIDPKYVVRLNALE